MRLRCSSCAADNEHIKVEVTFKCMTRVDRAGGEPEFNPAMFLGSSGVIDEMAKAQCLRCGWQGHIWDCIDKSPEEDS